MSNIIHVHIVCWNEIEFIPWIVSHYSTFATKIFFHDNHSDDGSRELIRQCPIAELVDYDTCGEIRDDLLIGLKNNCWKGRDADWVICADADEFVLFPRGDVAGSLQIYQSNRYAVPQTRWFEMIGNGIPSFEAGRQLYELIPTGVEGPHSKRLLFRPSVIEEMNYAPGAHECDPKLHDGWVMPPSSNPSVHILHFKYARPLATVLERHRINATRLSSTNRKYRWGFHYTEPQLAIDLHDKLRREAQPLEVLISAGRNNTCGDGIPAQVPSGKTGFLFPADVEGWLSEEEGMMLYELARGRRVLEIGSYCGRSTICLALSADRVISIDSHAGDCNTGPTDTFNRFLANIERYGVADRVEVRKVRLEDYDFSSTASVDLIFVDSEHTAETVERHTNKTLPKLAPGGIIAFHDFSIGSFPGYTEKVRQLFPNTIWAQTSSGSLGIFTRRRLGA